MSNVFLRTSASLQSSAVAVFFGSWPPSFTMTALATLSSQVYHIVGDVVSLGTKAQEKMSWPWWIVGLTWPVLLYHSGLSSLRHCNKVSQYGTTELWKPKSRCCEGQTPSGDFREISFWKFPATFDYWQSFTVLACGQITLCLWLQLSFYFPMCLSLNSLFLFFSFFLCCTMFECTCVNSCICRCACTYMCVYMCLYR